MDKLITIKTFVYPHDAFILKGKLEAEGVYCFLKDELTVQTDNFFSPAVGGVKLQVRESEYLQAEEILKAGGYLKEGDFTYPAYTGYFQKFDRYAQQLPLLKQRSPFFRIAFTAILILIMLAAIIYYFMLN